MPLSETACFAVSVADAPVFACEQSSILLLSDIYSFIKTIGWNNFFYVFLCITAEETGFQCILIIVMSVTSSTRRTIDESTFPAGIFVASVNFPVLINVMHFPQHSRSRSEFFSESETVFFFLCVDSRYEILSCTDTHFNFLLSSFTDCTQFVMFRTIVNQILLYPFVHLADVIVFGAGLLRLHNQI
jgi:hypothetical protein